MRGTDITAISNNYKWWTLEDERVPAKVNLEPAFEVVEMGEFRAEMMGDVINTLEG